MVRLKRSINALMAMAACPVRLLVLLQAKDVNGGCENRVKSIAETRANPSDRGACAAKFFTSSIFGEAIA
jgi:hypothetical protein